MSDLETAAAALDVPEEILHRSAAARAEAVGTTTDDILSAWAGGESAPAGQPPSKPDVVEAEPEAADGDSTAAAVTEQSDVAPIPSGTTQPPDQSVNERSVATPVVAASAQPPILESERERPFVVLLGAAAAFAIALIAGFVVPAVGEPGNGISTSEIALTQTAIDGKQLYEASGCATCHTQLVRPIAVDAGLGAVTLSDTNQVIGARRIGPDLSHVGARIEDPNAFRQTLIADPDHPAYTELSDVEIEQLTAYLARSR